MEKWVSSDTHLGHANILTFTDSNGKPVREFSSVEEMNETIIERHNSVVKPNDIWYCLGDVVINKRFLPLLDRMNGSKRLILGNHDPFYKEYSKYFTKTYAMRIFPRQAILTHVPIHPASIGRWGVNAHGHIHTETVMKDDYKSQSTIVDNRYINCCVDGPGNAYTPINLEFIFEHSAALSKEGRYD